MKRKVRRPDRLRTPPGRHVSRASARPAGSGRQAGAHHITGQVELIDVEVPIHKVAKAHEGMEQSLVRPFQRIGRGLHEFDVIPKSSGKAPHDNFL